MADPAPEGEPTPTVIVNHLDIVYTVYGGGRRGTPLGQDPAPLRERLTRRSEPKVREIHAVKDVSFVAHHGESIGIIGRNGSGKSTLLRAVAGLIPPAGGRLWVAGEPSLLGVNAVLMNKLSGERNIQIGAQALGLSKAEIAERFDDIVEFSGIGDAVYLPMSTYSSGMSARLRFAISTAASPEVLMIDEALATGDADFRAKSAARIAEIRQQAGTVFLVSHSNSSIRQMCDRALWMDQGHLIMDGPTEEVVSAYEDTLPKKKGKKQKKLSLVDDIEAAGTSRWPGEDRFEVAAAVTKDTWQPGVDGCFVVSIHRAAAARVVAPVAARLGWPLLWTRPEHLPTPTADELSRLQPSKVVVVGGEELVSNETYARIEALAPGPVERLGTDDDAQTSAMVLRAFPPTDTTTVHVTQPHSSGAGPVISLIAAQTGRAVLASPTSSVPAALLSAVQELAPQRLVFDGSEEDWSPDAVEAYRAATGATCEFSKRGALALAAEQWDDVTPGGEVLVAGRAIAELLTSVVAAVHTRRPLLIFGPGRVPDGVPKTLTRLAPRSIVLVGTLVSLPPAVRETLGGYVARD